MHSKDESRNITRRNAADRQRDTIS